MPGKLSIDEIVAAIRALDEQERLDLVGRLVKMDDLMEDFEDTLYMLHRPDDERKCTLEEFLAELRAEGRDV